MQIESSNGERLKGSERYVFKTVSYALGTGKWEEKFNVSPTKKLGTSHLTQM